jgi:hypothetical protein
VFQETGLQLARIIEIRVRSRFSGTILPAFWKKIADGRIANRPPRSRETLSDGRWSMVDGVLDTLFANLGTNSHSKALWRHRSDNARGRAHAPGQGARAPMRLSGTGAGYARSMV